MVEIWAEVNGTNGAYLVSTHGAVKSRRGIMKPRVEGKGYLSVKIKRKSNKVHRLVAKAFIPNPGNKPQVNHIDGNKQNNHVNNLEWVTGTENIRHAFRFGLFGSRKGELHPGSRMSDATRQVIADKHAAGASLLSLAKEYGFTSTHILRICKAHGTHRKRVAKYTGEARKVHKRELLRAWRRKKIEGENKLRKAN